MPTDNTSMYADQPKPLTQIGDLVNIQGGVQRNKMLGQGNLLLQGKVALGDKVTQNTVNGQTDWDKAYQDATADPKTAPVANLLLPMKDSAQTPTSYLDQSGVSHNVTMQQRQQQLTGAAPNPSQITPEVQTQIDAAHNKLGNFDNTIQSLKANPDASPDDVRKAITSHVASGDLNPNQAVQQLTQIPEDPAQIPSYLNQKDQALQAARAKLHPSSDMIQRNAQVGTTGPLPTLPASRANYDTVQTGATNAPNVTSALNEAFNLASKGDENISGTDITNIRERLAQTGVMPQAVAGATATQTLQKFIAQALINQGMPTSDARLTQLQAGNLKPAQLTSTIRELAPYLKAQEQAMTLKQQYYNKNTANGQDLSNEPAIKQAWDNSYDPRWVEYQNLNSAKDKTSFLQEHPDLLAKKDQFKAFRQLTQ